MTATNQLTWNLTELFPSITDPKIDQAIAEATARQTCSRETYRGKIASLSAEGLLQCLRDIEAFEAKFSDLASVFKPLVCCGHDSTSGASTKRQGRQTLSQHWQAIGILLAGTRRFGQKQASNNQRTSLIQLQALAWNVSNAASNTNSPKWKSNLSSRRISSASTLGKNFRVNGSTPASLTWWF